MGCYAYKQICMQEYARPEKISVDDELEVLVFKLYYREYDKRDEIMEERAVKLELEPQYRAEFIKELNKLNRQYYEDVIRDDFPLMFIPIHDYEYCVICRRNGKEMPYEFTLGNGTWIYAQRTNIYSFNAKKYIKASSWAKLEQQ